MLDQRVLYILYMPKYSKELSNKTDTKLYPHRPVKYNFGKQITDIAHHDKAQSELRQQ